MFMSFKNNRPNMQDIFIGHRIGDVLHITKVKQVPRDKREVKHNSALYPIVPESTTIMMKHLVFENPVHIIDEAYSSDIQGIHQKYLDKVDTKPEDLDNLEKEIKENEKNPKHKPSISLNINPIFMISATKTYKWIEGHMLDASFAAIIKDKVTRSIGLVIALVVLGATIGGMGAYIYTNNNYQAEINYLQTHQVTITSTQCPTISFNPQTNTTKTITTSIAETCIESIASSLSSLNRTLSSTTTTATVVAQSSFQNGTITERFSNGTIICVFKC